MNTESLSAYDDAGGIFCMRKRKRSGFLPDTAGMAFYPALEPLEAAVLPARAAGAYGTLALIPRAWEAGKTKISGQRSGSDRRILCHR